MTKIKCALIGPGNIGTDLLAKLQRSPVLEAVWMVGIDPESDGLKRARELGLKTTAEGVDGLVPHMQADGIQIVFDATSAYVHAENSRKVNEQGALMIDLTPAAIGPYCVPPVNLVQHVGVPSPGRSQDGTAPLGGGVARSAQPGGRLLSEMNVNMVTCGGQATIPMVAAVSRVQAVAYGEIVATVSSRSVGPGTRKNIDEFTRTTAGAVEKVGGAKKGKAIIINPADPPLIMRDTVHCLTEDEPNQEAITQSIHAMIAEVQRYVPGYRLVNGPVFDGKRVSVFMEVEGLGDYLPKYAGNLDIMTAAAARTAEMFAEEILAGRLTLTPTAAAPAAAAVAA
jgi:acetaldehyde/propanal dehydrogenase